MEAVLLLIETSYSKKNLIKFFALKSFIKKEIKKKEKKECKTNISDFHNFFEFFWEKH